MSKSRRCASSTIHIGIYTWISATARVNSLLWSGWISTNTKNSRTAGSLGGPAVNLCQGECLGRRDPSAWALGFRLLRCDVVSFDAYPLTPEIFSVTTKYGRRGLVSSTPIFFAFVPAFSVLPRGCREPRKQVPPPVRPALPHGYGENSNSTFRFDDIHGTHIPHGSYRSSGGSWE